MHSLRKIHRVLRSRLIINVTPITISHYAIKMARTWCRSLSEVVDTFFLSYKGTPYPPRYYHRSFTVTYDTGSGSRSICYGRSMDVIPTEVHFPVCTIRVLVTARHATSKLITSVPKPYGNLPKVAVDKTVPANTGRHTQCWFNVGPAQTSTGDGVPCLIDYP